LTYRMSDHTTADDASRYRPAGELEEQGALDPIARLRKYLEREGMWSEADEEKLRAEAAEQIEQAVRDYLATPPLPPEAMFDHLFAQLPTALQEQRDSLLNGSGS
jgi:2-oxoisovalerate dehydrogenase E1 component alpha subunit